MKSFRGFLSVCPCGELKFTVLDSSLSSKVQQAMSMRESLCFLISTTVVASQECYVPVPYFISTEICLIQTLLTIGKESVDSEHGSRDKFSQSVY